ncbi:hypothetical protein [Kribbella sp. HUAS MG21]|jgi:hypothetical protein|uniref:SRPBCC family protein n=1 Tax=Kribbella sp. HUAS MG21 TaxID=3160966 RepID=A0AAU7TE59_9ACTN
MHSRLRLGPAVTLAMASIELGLIYLGRAYGSTAAERRMRLPGDDIVAEPKVQTDHAVTVDAPPSAVWPWLVQMGWGRGGWYTARWVDRLLFPANGPSADRIVQELQDIDVGAFIPDGPPETECGLDVVEFESERVLVLRSNSHLPLSWRDRATLDWTWAFVLTPTGGGRCTRFHFRSRWVTQPWWFTLSGWLGVVPADFVMSRAMLRGVKARAEKLTSAAQHGRPPERPGSKDPAGRAERP